MAEAADTIEPRPADSSACRRFNLGDAMIVTAATAIVLGLERNQVARLPTAVRTWWRVARQLAGWEIWPYRFPRGEVLDQLVTGIIGWVWNVLVGILIAWTPAALLIRFRRPRPPLASLVRQPGLAACLAAT